MTTATLTDAAAEVIARCDLCATTDDSCRAHWGIKPALAALEALP